MASFAVEVILLGDQPLGAGNEIIKNILLVVKHPSLMPFFTIFSHHRAGQPGRTPLPSPARPGG